MCHMGDTFERGVIVPPKPYIGTADFHLQLCRVSGNSLSVSMSPPSNVNCVLSRCFCSIHNRLFAKVSSGKKHQPDQSSIPHVFRQNIPARKNELIKT